METKPSVLVVDDDPSHLRIYGWIMNSAGFRAVAAQVTVSGVALPDDENFDVVVLDYRLIGSLTAVEAAQQIRTRYPNVPIVLLSDIFGMPDEMAPYARQFVRKGDPEHLIATIRSLISPEKLAASRENAPDTSKKNVVA